MSEKHENRAETIERKMVIDLDRRRVTTLARLVGMLSIMAGDGPEIDGYDAAELHAEASMALGIEDADDIDGMAADIVEHGPDAHLLSDRYTARAAISDITAERERQLQSEGWTIEHDDTHSDGALPAAAACYAMGRVIVEMSGQNLWPWHTRWWKPKTRRADLVRAGALIVAEIERLDRHQ